MIDLSEEKLSDANVYASHFWYPCALGAVCSLLYLLLQVTVIAIDHQLNLMA